VPRRTIVAPYECAYHYNIPTDLARREL
jgi:hypothetical protein